MTIETQPEIPELCFRALRNFEAARLRVPRIQDADAQLSHDAAHAIAHDGKQERYSADEMAVLLAHGWGYSTVCGGLSFLVPPSGYREGTRVRLASNRLPVDA